MDLKVRAVSVKHATLGVLLAIASLAYLGLSTDPPVAAITIVVAIAIYLAAVKKLDYTDTYVVFALPWMMIVLFSLISISDYAKEIDRRTYLLIFAALFTGLLACGYRSKRTSKALNWVTPRRRSTVKAKYWIAGLDIALLSLTVLNIVIAGYIPLVSGLTTGQTGYLDFGVHGLYGFYLAFANALAVFYVLLYFRTKRKAFLLRYCMIIVIFILLVTRQNLLSLGVETVVVYSIVRGKISWRSILFLMLIAGAAFSLMGMFRSGSIKEIAQIKQQYMWIPDPLIWIYCYSYFNVANVDNLLHFSNAPYWNGSLFANLIPSFLRPNYNMQDYLQSANFNVSSYIYPVYEDIGVVGVIANTFIALWITERWYRKSFSATSLFSIGTFAVLYFCAAFSFFVNFWFYLPVIFQIVFFKAISNLHERAAREYRSIETTSSALKGTA